MMSKPEPPWKFVEVRWIDSSAHTSGGWSSLKDLPEISDMTTRGWLVKDEDDFVVLAGTYYEDQGSWMFGEYIAIPKVSFTSKMRELKLR